MDFLGTMVMRDTEILEVTEGLVWDCREDPARLKGLPIGMYHCPICMCMVVAGLEGHPHEFYCWLGLWDGES